MKNQKFTFLMNQYRPWKWEDLWIRFWYVWLFTSWNFETYRDIISFSSTQLCLDGGSEIKKNRTTIKIKLNRRKTNNIVISSKILGWKKSNIWEHNPKVLLFSWSDIDSSKVSTCIFFYLFVNFISASR